MPAPNAPVPAVVDRIPVDIDLSAGINERDRQELAEWSKQLTTAENVVLTESKALVKRPGLQYLNLTDDTAAAYYPVYRILPQSDGLAIVGKNFGLYHLDESTAAGTLVSKGRLPEFGVSRQTVDSWGDDGGNNLIRCVGTNGKYNVLIHEGGQPSYSAYDYFVIIISDAKSGNIVKKYVFDSADDNANMHGVVSGDYLHVAVERITTTPSIKHFVIDLNSLPTQSLSTPAPWTETTLATSPATLVGVAPMSGGSAVVCSVDAGTTYLEQFDSSGTSVTTGSVAFSTPTCVDSDGTEVYVTGHDGFNHQIRYFDNTFAQVSAVSGPAIATRDALSRVVVGSAGECRIIRYYGTTAMAGDSVPRITVYEWTVGDVAWSTVGTMRLWSEGSLPFYSSVTGRFYVVLLKQMMSVSGTTTSRDTLASAAVVVDITSADEWLSLSPSYGASAAYAFRPCAEVSSYVATLYNNEEHIGYLTQPNLASVSRVPFRPSTYSSYDVVVGLLQKATSKSYQYDIVSLKLTSPSSVSASYDTFCGGFVGTYDNDVPQELGFLEAPSVTTLTNAGAGSTTAGIHNYVAVYEYRDALGRSHYSRMSRPSTINLAGASRVTVATSRPSVTSHGRPIGVTSITTHVYATTAGGTVYYYVGSSSGLRDGSVTHNIADASLVAAAQPFRQPGISGTALDRYAALAGSHIVRHKDRVFYCNGSKVYYSSFAVDGEAPWFNPSFSFEVPGGSGPITALASMDGVLVVFKRDAIFLVDGDGPPENGGNGSEFSPPRRVLTEFGCPDPRMLVATPDGYMYRSQRGIELLDRSLQVKFIGRNVATTASAYPYNSGCAFDQVNGRVLFCVSDGVEADGRPAYTRGSRVLCYDIDARGWTTWRPYMDANTNYSGLVDLGSAQATIGGTTEQRVFLASEYYLGHFSSSTYLDYIYYQPMKLETGWVRFESAQDRIRIADFLALCKKQTNHNLKLSVAYDYSDSYSYTKTFTPATINALTLEQLELQVPSEAKMAMRFKLEDAEPADTVTYPVGTGEGPVVLALTPKVGRRGGGAKLSSDQKG